MNAPTQAELAATGDGAPIATAAPSKKCRPLYWRVVEIGSIFGALALGLCLRAYVFQMGYVPSDSMAPTLREGDRIIIDKRAYYSREPRRGEIVAFARDGELYVKRIVAVGGETVAVAGGRVFVDGAPLNEDYAQESEVRERPIGAEIEDGFLFVMGDNRDRSEDSRDYGAVSVSALVGRVTHVAWPIGRTRRLE